MASTFYVTAEERQALGTLPQSLTSSWQTSLTEESLTAFETSEQLSERMHNAPYHEVPGMKDVLARASAAVEAGRNPLEELSIGDLPKDSLPIILYSLGAVGITVMIGVSLADKDKLDSEAMEAVAALSRVRHRILEMNAAH